MDAEELKKKIIKLAELSPVEKISKLLSLLRDTKDKALQKIIKNAIRSAEAERLMKASSKISEMSFTRSRLNNIENTITTARQTSRVIEDDQSKLEEIARAIPASEAENKNEEVKYSQASGAYSKRDYIIPQESVVSSVNDLGEYIANPDNNPEPEYVVHSQPKATIGESTHHVSEAEKSLEEIKNYNAGPIGDDNKDKNSGSAY